MSKGSFAGMDACRMCGRPADHSDYARLAVVKYGKVMCQACYQTSKAKGYAASAQYCPKCGQAVGGASNTCPSCTVRDRVGADVFECDCGQVVDITDSVRMMRKPSNTIERVCRDCATSGTCKFEVHAIVTPQHKDWEPSRFAFQPLPDDFQPGVCAKCGLQMFWDGKRWTRMTWVALASAWETAGA